MPIKYRYALSQLPHPKGWGLTVTSNGDSIMLEIYPSTLVTSVRSQALVDIGWPALSSRNEHSATQADSTLPKLFRRTGLAPTLLPPGTDVLGRVPCAKSSFLYTNSIAHLFENSKWRLLPTPRDGVSAAEGVS